MTMTTLLIGNKKLNIKYGYAATIKSGIIAELMGMADVGEDMGAIEKLLMFLPKLLLVGLQKNHKDEYGCDFDSKESVESAMEKAYDLIDDYFENDGNLQSLFEALQSELMDNGFLSNMAKSKRKPKMVVTQKEMESTKSN